MNKTIDPNLLTGLQIVLLGQPCVSDNEDRVIRKLICKELREPDCPLFANEDQFYRACENKESYTIKYMTKVGKVYHQNPARLHQLTTDKPDDFDLTEEDLDDMYFIDTAIQHEPRHEALIKDPVQAREPVLDADTSQSAGPNHTKPTCCPAPEIIETELKKLPVYDSTTKQMLSRDSGVDDTFYHEGILYRITEIAEPIDDQDYRTSKSIVVSTEYTYKIKNMKDLIHISENDLQLNDTTGINGINHRVKAIYKSDSNNIRAIIDVEPVAFKAQPFKSYLVQPKPLDSPEDIAARATEAVKKSAQNAKLSNSTNESIPVDNTLVVKPIVADNEGFDEKLSKQLAEVEEAGKLAYKKSFRGNNKSK
jgi:hypothetical protein